MKIFGLEIKLADRIETVATQEVKTETKGTVGPLVDDLRIYRSLREILDAGTSVVSQPYKQSLWCYAAINAIVQNMCRVPFVLKKDAGTLEPSIIEQGPIYDLFQNPNPLMTLHTLLEATLTYYCLRGEAIWIKEGQKSITELPERIWCFDPMRFHPVVNKETGFQLGWEYRGRTTVYFTADEILQFKMFNPYNDLRGMSPIEAAQLSIDQDFYTSTFSNAFFKNGARVGGFITFPGEVELTDEQWNRIIKQFEDRHQGANKAYRIALIEGGGEFTEAKITQKDMEFIASKNLTRIEILAVYKVNEVVLGLYSSVKSYEGIKAAHKAFWEECLMPKIAYFEEAFWTQFFAKIGVRRGKGRIWAEWDLANVGPLQQNYTDKITTASKMFTMGWPINDINKRLQLGMKEVPWGDQWWVPGGYIPVTQVLGGDSMKPKGETTPVVTDSIPFPSPLKVEFENKLKKVIFNQRKRALAEAHNGRNWSNIQDEKEYAKLKVSLVNSYSQAVYTGMVYIQQQTGEIVPVNEYSTEITIYVDSRITLVIQGMKAIIDGIISVAPRAGTWIETNEELNGRLRNVFNLLTSKSSDIAKSEIEAAFNWGVGKVTSSVRDILRPSIEWTKKEDFPIGD